MLRLEYNPDRSPYYRIRGKFLGVRIDRSTSTSDRRLAEKMLRDAVRKIEDDAKRGPVKPPGKSFAAGVTSYIRRGGNHRFMEPLLRYFGEKPMDEITQEMIDEAACVLYPQGTPATRNRQVYSPMSAVLRSNNIALPLVRPRGSQGKQRTFFFEPQEVERLIKVATEDDPEFGLFLTFLLYTGLRVTEALSLQIRHLNLPESRAYIETTKNGLPRTVHLPPPLVAALANHPRGYDRDGRVFRFCKGSRCYGKLYSAAEKARVMIPDHCGFHAFRHTYGAFLRRYGRLDTSGLVAAGAWKSHEAARRYEHVDVSEAAKASDFFPVVQIFGGNGG